jgi:ribosomal protein S18 acetylase RimI-like enzyme
VDGEVVGAVRTARFVDEPGRYHLGNIMILPRYQGLGIGQEALSLLESRYPDAKTWELDTLLQETRNLHFYEKLGYRRIGEPRVVNERLSLVEYKKWASASN